MHNHSGQAVIRLGDKTSHGGEVIAATATITVHSIAVALEGDMTYCPKCKGEFAILPSGEVKRTSGAGLLMQEPKRPVVRSW
jgi:uncharacterized Zn-binding protein involved in type VI secretion